MRVVEYPKWVAVDGPGHPHNPGKVLVENAEQEREALESGKGPEHLNPPVDEARAAAQAVAPVAATLSGGVPDKPVNEQSREELCATAAALLMRSPLSDAELRDQIESLTDYLDSHSDREPSEDTPEFSHENKDGPHPITDAAGDEVPPPQDQEANKDALAPGTRTLPLPELDPGHDARSADSKNREPGDHPATDQIEQAETKPDETKPPEQGGAAATKAKAAKK